MPSPILARADALMQRRRQSFGETDDVPILTDSVDLAEDPRLSEPVFDDDDVPVLLDEEPAIDTIVLDADVETTMPAEPFIGELAGPELSAPEPAIAELAADMAVAPPIAQADAPDLQAGIRDILVHELARRVEERLIAELPRLIESAVQDFLAEQQMIAALQAKD